MKTLTVLFALVSFLFSYAPIQIDDVEGETTLRRSVTPIRNRVLIDSVGDIRAIMGGQGKNIIVSQNAEAIAVIYGAPTGDPNNMMKQKVAYSRDRGRVWTKYGPFSGNCRRLYNAVDGALDFNTVGGHLYFCWQENTLGYNDGAMKFMIQEKVSTASSFVDLFSIPSVLCNSQAPAMYPWEPDIAVAPDDPLNLIVTAFNYLAGGNGWTYCWISTDGGYTWTDTIPMMPISADGSAGNLSRGTDGYVVYAYHDYYLFTTTDSTPYPYYIESTDGGYTWSAETPVPGVPVNTGSQFWWHEFDCLVIDNKPWFVHNDIGSPGGGPYVIKGTGSPGNWTWSIRDAGVIGYDSTYYSGQLWYCVPSQYPSLSYDPVSNTVLVTYKSNIYVGNGSTYNGAHIQGVYTYDGGSTWYISDPLSAANNGAIIWGDWSATETAHHLVHVSSWPKVYSVWVDGTALVLCFECEWLTPWGIVSAVESGDAYRCTTGFSVKPSVSRNDCTAKFVIQNVSNASLVIYDALGRHVENVLSQNLSKGEHTLNINTSHLTSGTYFVVLQTETSRQVEKIVVAK